MATGVMRSIPRVFDRYMLPKVAFTMVTLASMAGAVLTGLRHGWSDMPAWAVRWGAYWTLGVLLGAEVWKIFYLRPSVRMRPTEGADEYGRAMLLLHRKWERVLTPLAGFLTSASLTLYATRHDSARPWVVAGTFALVLALGGVIASWRSLPDTEQHTTADLVALVGLAASVALLGALDVALQRGGAPWLLIPNRVLHLWAFSAWLGGALWNIFIAVPAGVTRVNMDTVILANFQLERFRVVVRTVFPTIVLTGLVQAWAMFGFNWGALFTNTWGYLVLAKIGLILLLVGVFIACPMWRACSPIRGVCDLDDL